MLEYLDKEQLIQLIEKLEKENKELKEKIYGKVEGKELPKEKIWATEINSCNTHRE